MKLSHILNFAAGVAAMLLPVAGHSATLVTYQFGAPGSETTVETAPGFAATFVAPNLTATPVTDPAGTVGLETSSAATTPAGAPFLRIDPQGSSANAAEAVANSKYFQFTIAPTSGFVLNATTLTFNAARGGAGTPRGYAVRSSADNFATDLATADLLTSRPAYTAVSVDLSTAGFQNISSTSGVTFRIFSYSTGGGASVDYDDITLNGAVTSSVPEPTSLGLLMLASVGLLGCVRGRRA